MRKLKIKLIILGGIKYNFDLKGLIGWKTNFFEIDKNVDIIILQNSLTEENERYYYTDEQLLNIIGETTNYDLTVALINQKIEKNYYDRSIGNNTFVLSLFETGEIIIKNDFKINQFIIQGLYYYVALYYRTKGKIPNNDDIFTHHDIRKCLFDFNDDKNDIAYSLGQASICTSCESEYDKTFVPKDFIRSLRNELKRIKKGRFYRIRDFIKRNPISALIIAALSTIIINLFSNIIYNLICKHFF